MAPPVPVKKKISIPSVFLVDDRKVQAGNGSTTYVRTMDRPPPPRPVRPPPVTGVVAGQLNRNPLNLTSTSSQSRGSPASPPQPPPSTQPGPNGPLTSSQSLLSCQSPSVSMVEHQQPHPPPRRHQVYSSSGGPSYANAGRSTELQSKCLLSQVNVVRLLIIHNGEFELMSC